MAKVQLNDVLYSVLWTPQDTQGSHTKGDKGSLIKGFVYAYVPSGITSLRFPLSDGQTLVVSGEVSFKSGVTVKFEGSREGKRIFSVTSTSTTGVLRLEGSYRQASIDRAYTPFSMDMFIMNPPTDVVVPSGESKVLYTDAMVSAHPFQSGIITLTNGVFKLAPSESFRLVNITLRSSFLTEDTTPCEWALQIQRPTGDVISSAYTHGVATVMDMPSRELTVNSYTYGGSDPYVSSGFCVAIFNNTKADLTVYQDSLRVDVMENPPSIYKY